MQFLQSLNLSRKIALGFTVVLVLHVVVALVGHLGLENASRDLQRLDEGRDLANRIVEIDDSVGRLQREILNYTQTGQPALADRIRELVRALVQDLDSTAAQAPMEDRPALEKMQASLTRYRDQFEAMVVDRERREWLLYTDLIETGEDLERRLSVLIESGAVVGNDGKLARRLTLERALRSVSSARLQSLHYISQLDPAAIRSAREELRDVAVDIRGIQPGLPEESAASARIAGELVLRLDEHLTELVQVTRGYLHLVNVVLAGEAAEFQYESAQLRERNLARLESLTGTIATQQREFQSASLWVSVVTILMGLIAGSAIGRIVVQPLRAIASTLGRLATEEEQPQIPCIDRQDEVGEMARAAEVFRQKNEQTAQLLSETQRLAREHEEVIHDLERTNAELDNFANVASHDLKAPLRAISSLSEWIEEDMPEDLPEAVDGHLRALRQRTARMGKLLDDLLDYSRASREEFRRVDVDLRTLGQDVWDLAGFPDDMEFTYSGDDVGLCTARVPLEQVLGNLFSNAVKHHDRERGRVELCVADRGEFVELTVSDDGPGVDEEHHERIFEVFQTLKRRDDVEASGIGLALVRKHVELQGGDVEVRSPHGQRGCAFVVRWPKRVVEPKGPLPSMSSAPQPAAPVEEEGVA